MTTKLNDLAVTSVSLQALPGTFQAVVEYCKQYSGSPSGPPTLVGTLTAALAGGIGDFWSPVLPRGLRLNTAEEVAAADLDVQHVQIEAIEVGDPDLIVSGHAGTIEVLRDMFPQAEVVTGNVTAEAVVGQVVAGTLPPHLVSAAAGYYPATITDFDYAKDGDLAGGELRERLVIGDAVRVTVS